MQSRRRLAFGALGLLTALVLAACSPGGSRGSAKKPALTVGVSGSFAESQIVAEMYAQVLENAGYTVTRQTSLRSREVSQPALESGQIDLKPEYLGTLLAFLDPSAKPSADPAVTVGPLRKLLDARGIALLDYSPANDTNAFVVTRATARKYNLRTVSDLMPVARSMTLGGPPECEIRPFCLPGLKNTYGVEFGKVEKIGACDRATADALSAGKIDVALLCSTQAIISSRGWVALKDDKNLQTADNIAPVIRKKVLNGEIRQLLNGVSKKLTTPKITRLNARVELDNDDPQKVAAGFLKQEGLV